MKFTFGNLPSIGWSDPAGKLVALARLCELQRALPEVTGLRLYSVPPAGKPLFDGYQDMVRGFGRVAVLVNGAAARSVPVTAWGRSDEEGHGETDGNGHRNENR